MRFVIFGAGAVGGVVGARLHQAGCDVTLIARGAHYQSIKRDGLRLETPVERVVLEIPVVDDPAAVDWREDHIVLLAIKSQDTAPALAALAIETDYLNGEIALLGRLHGVPTPVNQALCQLADRVAREHGAPEQLSADDVFAALS
jgi:ketopantoate reductase